MNVIAVDDVLTYIDIDGMIDFKLQSIQIVKYLKEPTHLI